MLLGFIVASKTVDARLDKNQAELGVLIFAVNFQVLADGDRLFDEVPKVLRDGWSQSYPQTKRYVMKSQRKNEGEKQTRPAVHEKRVNRSEYVTHHGT